jgi:hypothetical protein
MLSNGLFIWATTACKLLRNSRQSEQILERLAADKAEKPEGAEGTDGLEDSLDPLYMEVLKQALIVNNNSSELMLKVLQVIINAYEPISINTVELLLRDNEHIKGFVQNLASVLKGGDPDRLIRVLHPTFRQFITSPTKLNDFSIDAVESHALITLGCLNLLKEFLKYDLLDLAKLYQSIPSNSDIANLSNMLAKRLTPALCYASSYWPYHAASSIKNSEVLRVLQEFLDDNLLHWLELMSLRAQIPVCNEGLARLCIECENWSNIDQEETQVG